MRAKLAAHSMHAMHDTKVVTAAGRAAAWQRFEDLVDPGRQLDHVERSRRADHARRAHMVRLAFLSARARRKGSKDKTAPAVPTPGRSTVEVRDGGFTGTPTG